MRSASRIKIEIMCFAFMCSYLTKCTSWFILLHHSEMICSPCRFAFCLWDQSFTRLDKLWTVYVLTGEDRSSVAVEDGRFVLLKTDTVVYAACLEKAGERARITQERLINSFFLIQSDWKTGEM